MMVLLVTGWLLLFAGAAPAGENPADILPVDETTVREIIHGLKGKVVVINVWATWCEPCVEEFPDLLRLRRAYSDRGLDLVFVSVDDPRKREKEVRRFLSRMGVEFPSYIKQTRNDEAFINTFNPQWSGALPATFIYDRTGKQVHTLTDQQTFEDLSTLVEPLILQKRP
jgi:thiol-disulfide isomerase/thioredoxin